MLNASYPEDPKVLAMVQEMDDPIIAARIVWILFIILFDCLSFLKPFLVFSYREFHIPYTITCLHVSKNNYEIFHMVLR